MLQRVTKKMSNCWQFEINYEVDQLEAKMMTKSQNIYYLMCWIRCFNVSQCFFLVVQIPGLHDDKRKKANNWPSLLKFLLSLSFFFPLLPKTLVTNIMLIAGYHIEWICCDVLLVYAVLQSCLQKEEWRRLFQHLRMISPQETPGKLLRTGSFLKK